MLNNSSTIATVYFLPFWRHPVYLTVIYFLAYGLVFVAGLVGNLFVVLAVALNPRMRVTTNYFITSLATADLLVIIFCLPATLMNNVVFGLKDTSKKRESKFALET
uniref:G-protein coupled receptors family 1 profile domain-containing protein n=1 Tax=Romanomermis culicivorax TaxID=13658 RepID=A0A915HQT3_ROMCU